MFVNCLPASSTGDHLKTCALFKNSSIEREASTKTRKSTLIWKFGKNGWQQKRRSRTKETPK